jgi:hypothetical protein
MPSLKSQKKEKKTFKKKENELKARFVRGVNTIG